MSRSSIVWALVLTGAVTVARESRAQDCGTLPENAVVVAGSSAIQPLIKGSAGPLLMSAGIDVYYANVGSCTGSKDLFVHGGAVTATVSHYDATGTEVKCNLAAGTKPDVGVSDVFYKSCGEDLPAGYADIAGPAQAMLFVVPRMSSQKALVAEEGYFVFGFGSAGYKGATVAPWSDMSKLIIRNEGSGTQQMTSRAVGIQNAAAMKGVDAKGSGGVVTMLKALNDTAANAEGAIGILGADLYDAADNRASLKALAFQAFHQIHAYLPDSTPTSFDKRNVRDGKYVVWGPSHLIVKTGPDGKAENAHVAKLVDIVTGAQPLGGPDDFLKVVVSAHLIPQCAMKVQRSTELGDLSPYTAPAGTACGCFMEETLVAGSSGCTACTMDAQCGSKKCSHGFCE
jgi:ABC-type phosphate transport system substrate-binding protein